MLRRDGVENGFLWWIEGLLSRGGVISVCIARTEEGFLNGERRLRGVCELSDMTFPDSMYSSSDMSLGDRDVRGELCGDGRSKISSSSSPSGPLE